MKTQKGFSLTELIIVLLLIGIIAAIAIPNLIRSRRDVNEAHAQMRLRTLYSAEITYQVIAGHGSFGSLAELRSQRLVDSVIASGASSKYLFAVDVKGQDGDAQFWASAVPVDWLAGRRRFAITEMGALRTDTNLSAPKSRAEINAMPLGWPQ